MTATGDIPWKDYVSTETVIASLQRKKKSGQILATEQMIISCDVSVMSNSWAADLSKFGEAGEAGMKAIVLSEMFCHWDWGGTQCAQDWLKWQRRERNWDLKWVNAIRNGRVVAESGVAVLADEGKRESGYEKEHFRQNRAKHPLPLEISRTSFSKELTLNPFLLKKLLNFYFHSLSLCDSYLASQPLQSRYLKQNVLANNGSVYQGLHCYSHLPVTKLSRMPFLQEQASFLQIHFFSKLNFILFQKLNTNF